MSWLGVLKKVFIVKSYWVGMVIGFGYWVQVPREGTTRPSRTFSPDFPS